MIGIGIKFNIDSLLNRLIDELQRLLTGIPGILTHKDKMRELHFNPRLPRNGEHVLNSKEIVRPPERL